MRLDDLSPEVSVYLENCRWDRIIEKHEGPWDWRYLVNDRYAEFLSVDDFDVLLPIEKSHHPNITIERCIPSSDFQTLTIFLRDTTFDSGMFAGYIAVCEQFPGEDWYIAILYHECWVHKLEANTNRLA